MRIARLDYKKITYPDADAPLFGTQLYLKVEPDDEDPESPTPADGTDDQISIQINDEAAVVYHSKWFGGVCWFFFDVKAPVGMFKSYPYLYLDITYNDYSLTRTTIRLGSWVGSRIPRIFNGTTLFKTIHFSSFTPSETGVYYYIKLQNSLGVSIKSLIVGGYPTDAVLGFFDATEYDMYYYCSTNSDIAPAEDYEGWLGGYEIKPICSTLGIEPQKSKFYWVDRYGFIHTYYFEVTSITNGKGEKVEYSKTIQDTNANISYYKTSISQPKITKAFQSEDEDLKNIKDIATLGSAMYLEINDVPTDPSLISALVVPNEKGLSRLTFSVDFNIENKNVVLW